MIIIAGLIENDILMTLIFDPNFVIEPSSLNGGEPFFANPYNPVVHNKPSREYHEFVKNEVRGE